MLQFVRHRRQIRELADLVKVTRGRAEKYLRRACLLLNIMNGVNIFLGGTAAVIPRTIKSHQIVQRPRVVGNEFCVRRLDTPSDPLL